MKRGLIGFIFFGFCQVQATTPDDFMNSFQSSRILMPPENSEYTAVNPGRYPPFLIWLFQKALAWEPLGKKQDYDPGCAPEDLYQQLVTVTDAQEQARRIEKHKKVCGYSFQNGSTWQWFNSLRIMGMELKIHEHSNIRRVVLNLPGGTRIKGLLALKGDEKKRPFAVIRLGIYSNVEEFLPERYLLMQLYEQGLANVLVLENMSSADFIANNKRSSMGGYEEGIQNIQVARILRDPKEPISKLISSLHFLGISFGGHGVLFASLLNDLNKRPIESFTGICPVVNLKDSFNSLIRNNIMGIGADYWSSLRLEGLRTKDPKLADYGVMDIFKMKPVFLPRVIEFLEEEFVKNPPVSEGIRLPPKPYADNDLWQANDFWGAYRNIQSPLLVFGTVHDSMVSPNDNIYWLDGKAKDWNSNLGVVIFEEGFHCTLPIAYDWPTIASLFNGRIMAYDRRARLSEKKLELKQPLTESDKEIIRKNHFTVSWVNGDREVLLKFSKASISIPMEDFDFKFSQVGDAEKTTIERWIYHNVQGQIQDQKAYLHWPWVL